MQTNHWFKVTVHIPKEFEKYERVQLEFDMSGEAMVFDTEGNVYQGACSARIGQFPAKPSATAPADRDLLNRDVVARLPDGCTANVRPSSLHASEDRSTCFDCVRQARYLQWLRRVPEAVQFHVPSEKTDIQV